MRKTVFAALVVLLLVASGAPAATISGNYLEARTASVWVGACFANSEMGLVGQEAVMGWQVTDGRWNGVSVAGLSVVGVVRAADTLGTRADMPASSVIIVDQKASAEQAQALVSFVRASAPRLFARVVHVETAPIQFVLEETSGAGHHGHASGAAAKLVVGDLARVVTREIREHDATCANAERYYEPLVAGIHAEPAFTTAHEYRGNGLGSVWSNPNRPSAYVGTFAR